MLIYRCPVLDVPGRLCRRQCREHRATAGFVLSASCAARFPFLPWSVQHSGSYVNSHAQRAFAAGEWNQRLGVEGSKQGRAGIVGRGPRTGVVGQSGQFLEAFCAARGYTTRSGSRSAAAGVGHRSATWKIERWTRDRERIWSGQLAGGSDSVGSIPRLGSSARVVQLALRRPSFRGLAGQEGRCLSEEANQGLLVGDKIAQQNL